MVTDLKIEKVLINHFDLCAGSQISDNKYVQVDTTVSVLSTHARRESK